MADVFLSYSRRDRDFALRLHDALVARGKDVWVDEQDIPPNARWRDELREAIAGADSFAFLISPDSASSPQCAQELQHAETLGKRVIGVMVRATEPDALPDTLAARQFVPQRGCFDDDFERSVDTLTTAIETDLEWVKAHTLWGSKAREWETHGRDRSFLLSGSELSEAEQWLARQAGKEPAPTELQATYVLLSRQRTTRRLRITLAAAAVALLVAIALSVVALIERSSAIANQQTSQSRQLAASAESTLGSDPELSALLALRALAIHYTTQAEAALRDALPRLQILATLKPSAPLYSPSFSSDGKTVLTASADGSAETWNADTGARERVFGQANGTQLEQTLFSPDGKKIVTASDDGTARIWDVATGERAAAINEPGGEAINGAAFSPDGKLLVTGSSRLVGPADNQQRLGDTRIWNATTGAQVGSTITTPDVVFAVAFSPDGQTVASASGIGVARVWDVRTGALLHTLKGPDDSGLYAIQFSPDGRKLVTASSGGSARVWDTATGRLLLTLTEPGHAALYNAAFSSDSARVLTVSADGSARIWSATDGSLLGEVQEPERSPLEGAGFSPDGSRIVTASLDGFARVWDVRSRAELTILHEQSDNPLEQASFSADGSKIVTAGTDGTARIWDARTRQLLGSLIVPATSFTAAQFSPDGRLVLTTDTDGAARLWSTASDRQVGSVPEPARRPWLAGSFSPDGRLFATASADDVAVWETATRHQISQIGGAQGASTVAFSPDGRRLVTTIANTGVVSIWDVRTGRPVETLANPRFVADAVFSPDGKSILTADQDGVGRMWDLATRTPTVILVEPGNAPLLSATFSPDGQEILTASSDGTARLWSRSGGPQISVFAGHQAGVTDAQFSPDGTLVVTASNDGTAKLWSAAPRDERAAFGSGVIHAGYAPGGKLVITAGGGGSRIWNGAAATPIDVLPALQSDRDAAVSPDGRLAFTVASSTVVTKEVARVWDLATGRLLKVLGGNAANAAFSPDGTMIATSSLDGVRLWNSRTLQLIKLIVVPRGSVNVAFDGRGDRLATADFDGTARIVDVRTGLLTNAVSEPGIPTAVNISETVAEVAFSPDGRQILTASLDGTARLWNATTGAPSTAFAEPGGGGIVSVAFSPDGREVATGSLDGTARIWDVATGQQLTFFSNGAQVNTVEFSADGSELLTGGGRARIWSTDLAGPLPSIERIARALLTRGFTADEVARYLVGIGP